MNSRLEVGTPIRQRPSDSPDLPCRVRGRPKVMPCGWQPSGYSSLGPRTSQRRFAPIVHCPNTAGTGCIYTVSFGLSQVEQHAESRDEFRPGWDSRSLAPRHELTPDSIIPPVPPRIAFTVSGPAAEGDLTRQRIRGDGIAGQQFSQYALRLAIAPYLSISTVGRVAKLILTRYLRL